MHPLSFLYIEPQGQSWVQLQELALALVLLHSHKCKLMIGA